MEIKKEAEKKDQVKEINKEIPEVITENPKNEEKHPLKDLYVNTTSANDFGKIFKFQEDENDNDINEIGDSNLQDLIDEFESLNCKGNYKKDHQASNYVSKEKKFEEPVYCSSKIKDDIFEKIPALGYSPTMFNKWMNDNIYLPLGYKVDYNYSYSSILNQFMKTNKKHSQIHPEMQITNNRDFQNLILKSFETIEDASSNFFNNKGQISNIIFDLLKKFHIYWNVHRQRGQIDNLHTNTLTILKSLFNKYKQTNDAMKAVTLHLLKNINEAYSKFVKADSMQTLMKQNSSEMIVIQMLRRVKEIAEKLHQNKLPFDL